MHRHVHKVVPWRFFLHVMRRFNDDQGAVFSGYIAYAAMLSAMPFLIFATALAGQMIGQQDMAPVMEMLFEVAPEHVALTIEPALRQVATGSTGSILTFSALGAIYAASNGAEAIRIGLDRAYDVESKGHFMLNRFKSILFVLLAFVTFNILGVLIILAPLGFRLLETWTDIQIPGVVQPLRYITGIVVMVAFLWVVHRFLPTRNMQRLILWPGIVASMAIWGIVASLMSVYLAYVPDYSLTYGTLAGVIVTLLFFYLTGVAIIFGAEINAALNFDAPWAERVQRRRRRPRGRGRRRGRKNRTEQAE